MLEFSNANISFMSSAWTSGWRRRKNALSADNLHCSKSNRRHNSLCSSSSSPQTPLIQQLLTVMKYWSLCRLKYCSGCSRDNHLDHVIYSESALSLRGQLFIDIASLLQALSLLKTHRSFEIMMINSFRFMTLCDSKIAILVVKNVIFLWDICGVCMFIILPTLKSLSLFWIFLIKKPSPYYYLMFLTNL